MTPRLRAILLPFIAFLKQREASVRRERVRKIQADVHRFGAVAEEAVVAPLVKSAQVSGKIAAYRSLSQDAEMLVKALNGIGGALAVPLMGRDCCVVFQNVIHTQINWAGAPDKELSNEESFVPLAPRESFALYSETVMGRCEPWRPIDRELVEGLATIVMQTASQRARLEPDQCPGVCP